MKTTIRYNQATKQERLEAALLDCQRYIGNDWQRLLDNIRTYWQEETIYTRQARYRGVRMALAMFVGIEGRYPVSAIIRAALAPAPTRKQRYLKVGRSTH